MVADKFPNGLIGPIGPNPNGLIGPIGPNPIGPIGPNRHGSPCTLLSTPDLLLEGVRLGLSQK